MFDGQIIRFFLLLTVFASVFLFIHLILRSTVANRSYASAVNKRLKLIAQGASREVVFARLRKNDPAILSETGGLFNWLRRSLHRNLLMASVPFGPLEVGLAMLTLFVGLALLISIASWLAQYPLTAGVLQLIVAVSASIAIAIPMLVIRVLAQRRRKRMQEQFPVALDVFVRALRSGHPVASAIELLTQEMADPIGSEFGLVADEVAYGADQLDSLSSMAERWNLEDMRMFVVSLSVQNETGGNLAEILENLASVIRDRAAMYLKVRALSSEGRMTGWLLTVLPIITFVLLFLINPSFYLDVASDPIFYIGFPLLLVWYLIGVLAIRNMINLEV